MLPRGRKYLGGSWLVSLWSGRDKGKGLERLVKDEPGKLAKVEVRTRQPNCLALDVCFSPKAIYLLRGNAMTLRVNRVVLAVRRLLPVYSDEQTFAVSDGISRTGPNAEVATHSTGSRRQLVE